MKKISIYIISIFFISISCKSELDIPAQGILSPDQISNYKDADAFVTAAYSQLGNDHYNYPFSLWPYGDVRSEDSYKGGRDLNDNPQFNQLENPQILVTDNARFDALWYRIYIGIRRANEAIKALKKFDQNVDVNYNSRLGEMYFIRGYWYFKLKILFKHVPYLTDETPVQEYDKIPNNVYTDQELWDLIAADFKKAIDLLPATQSDKGRANKIAAHAFYAKTRLYQAYVQNDKHEVISIDKNKLQEVVASTDQVIQSTYGLEDDYAKNFLFEYENGKESIFAIQFSTNDGVGTAGRLDRGFYTTAPQGLGCCDLHKASQNLVNAFKTTSSGVPMFDTFNLTNANFSSDNFDPRMDHTLARPNVPWKYETNRLFTQSWSRTPSIYGYYNSLKENVSPDCNCYKIDGSFRGNSKNRIEMRYADVLLFKAEALIELDRHAEALPIINLLRKRAANSTGRLKFANNTPLANYKVEEFVDGQNIVWNKENARKALRFERRLELALESSRFFDLVRWGIASEALTQFYQYERDRMPNLYTTATQFTKNKHEYLPIPQAQINWSKGLYVQNLNYE